MQSPVYNKTATMTKDQFIAHCRAEHAKRQDNADREYRDYMLTLIGTNPNDVNSYAVCSPEGNVYQPRAGRTYLIGRVGKNGFHVNPDESELCPDDYRTQPLNARLAAMGEAAFVRGKHQRIRTLLFLELPEVMPGSEAA